MNKLSFLSLILTFILSSCSCSSDEESKPTPETVIKETVTNYLKKHIKNPESFKIISIEIRKDTIPNYLTDEVLSLADDFVEALDKFSRYDNLGYLWYSERSAALSQSIKTQDSLKSAYESAMSSKDLSIEYIAYVEFSGTNAVGGTISNRSIIIVDSKDMSKVLGDFLIDKDFIKQFCAIKMSCENYNFKKNKYGKYDTEGLPFIEQFILNDADTQFIE